MFLCKEMLKREGLVKKGKVWSGKKENRASLFEGGLNSTLG